MSAPPGVISRPAPRLWPRAGWIVFILAAAITPCRAAPDPPNFDHTRGFYNSAFSLALTSATGSQIRYTLDGSAPAATTGTVYSGPISITTTTVVRAVAYVDASNVSVSVTHTYVFLNDVIHQPTSVPTAGTKFVGPNWPSGYLRNTYAVNKQTTNNGQSAVLDYQMDPAIVGSSAYSTEIIPALTAIPTMEISTNVADIWGTNGWYDGDSDNSAAEKPVSLEILYPSSPSKNLQVNCGIHGHSNVRLKRAFHLVFSKTYGPGKLTSTILQDGPLNGASANNKFDDLILRSGYNRAWACFVNADATTYTEDE